MKAADMQSTLPLSIENPSTERCQWRTVPLRDIIFHPDYGVTASATIDPVGPKFLRITDIGKLTIDWDRVPHCRCSDREKEEKRLRNGDLVVARIGATTGITYLYRSYDVPAVFASYLIRIRCSETLSPEFLNQFSQSPLYWNQVDAIKQGRLKEGINTEELKSLMIPLPPLPEQQRIATVLATVDEAIAATDAIITKIEVIHQELRDILFTQAINPQTNKDTPPDKKPKQWEIRSIESLCSLIVDCPHSTPKYIEVGFLVIRNYNIRDGRLDLLFPSFTSEEEFKERNNRAIPTEGDVLFSREAPMGEACMLPSGVRCCLGQRMMLLRPDPDSVDSMFLVHSIYSPPIRQIMKATAMGQTVLRLNIADVKRLPIPLPPLPKQRRIAAILATVDDRLATERAERDRLVTLKKGLMQVLLTGRVRVPPGVAEEVAPAHV